MIKKKKAFIIIFVIILVCLIFLAGFIVYKNYNKNSFTVKENEWIDNNKNKVIDIYLLNEVPILNYNGDGLIFDFFDDLEKKINIKFNKNAYRLDDDMAEKYSFRITDNVKKDDILILKDNFVLVTNNSSVYNKAQDMKNLNIGILKADENIIKEYYTDIDISTNNINFTIFDDYSTLMNELSHEDTKINSIIILKTLYTNDLIKNTKFKIGYQYLNLNKNFVITIKDNEVLKSIVTKYYNTWSENKFDKEYDEYLLNQYFKVKNISDIKQKELKSKKYKYAFIDNGIYDNLSNSKLHGMNSLVLKKFTEFSKTLIEYQKYNSLDRILRDFNKGKIDIFFNNTSTGEYDIEHYNTNASIDSTYVVISNNKNKIVVNSLMDLNDAKIVTLKFSSIESYLKSNNVNVKSYNNMKELISNIDSSSIIVIDLKNYEYYKNNKLANYKLDFMIDNKNNYNYTINNSDDNKVFSELFDFYTSYMSLDNTISEQYNSVVINKKSYYPILLLIIFVLLIVIIYMFIAKIKKAIKTFKNNRKLQLSKEDKIKYIDQLTSLKNRAYLNSKIESWDDSEVYPQAIIIVDLNNVAYINDNYGREEGDKVITEAANILILSQLPNTEIIRTDGNEFLIYLVGYDEKHIISYLRKLNKLFKGLSHGFSAASGYSIIKNGIKTVDDAVNEATLDMRNNKEDINY